MCVTVAQLLTTREMLVSGIDHLKACLLLQIFN